MAASYQPAIIAWSILSSSGLKSGDHILVDSDSSPIGSALKQLAKEMGATVAVFDGSKPAGEKRARLCVSSKPSVAGKMLAHLTPENGVVVVHNDDADLSVVPEPIKLSTGGMIFGETTVRGFDFAQWARAHPDAFKAAVAKVDELVAAKKLSVAATAAKFSDFQSAVQTAAGGKHTIMTL